MTSDSTTATTEPKMFQRKCPFHVPSDNIEFNNMPGLGERMFIRTFHWIQRVLLQWGAFDSWNPIVLFLSAICYAIDMPMSQADPEYWVKRHAMFGDNYVVACSLNIAKFDDDGKAQDSFDGRVLTIPQRRTYSIGVVWANPRTCAHSGTGKGLTTMFTSDEGCPFDKNLPDNQISAFALRNWYKDNFLSKEHMDKAIARQTDETGKKLLAAFGEDAKGKTGDELAVAIHNFAPKFLLYTILDCDIDHPSYPTEAIQEGVSNPKFAIMHFGPGWLCKRSKLNKKMRAYMDEYIEYISEHSGVLKNYNAGDTGLTKADLCEVLPIMMGLGGTNGTETLANVAMNRMPEGYAKEVANDPVKMKNALYECVRLDGPVGSTHCIIDEDDFETEIGGKKLKFRRGTKLTMNIKQANVDPVRFPNPYVFDPENRDFERITGFNGIGEKQGTNNRRTCPGRFYGVAAVTNMFKAKLEAESKGSYGSIV